MWKQGSTDGGTQSRPVADPLGWSWNLRYVPQRVECKQGIAKIALTPRPFFGARTRPIPK